MGYEILRVFLLFIDRILRVGLTVGSIRAQWWNMRALRDDNKKKGRFCKDRSNVCAPNLRLSRQQPGIRRRELRLTGRNLPNVDRWVNGLFQAAGTPPGYGRGGPRGHPSS